MVWVYTGDRLRNLTRIECEDFDIDVNEGRDEPDPTPTCPECNEITDGPCGCIEWDE